MGAASSRPIAAYLGEGRAVRGTPEPVIVVGGSRQPLDLAAQVLLDPGDSARIEDPGDRAALAAAQAHLLPVPVDGGNRRRRGGTPRPGLTPSHQYPPGVTMSLGRRSHTGVARAEDAPHRMARSRTGRRKVGVSTPRKRTGSLK